MSANHEQPLDDSATAGPSDAGAATSMARRRAILKGLGKGAALAGAAAPLSSLAGSGQRMRKPNGTTNVLCTISGQMSVLTSGATSLPVCSGKTVEQYRSMCANTTTMKALPLVTKNGKTLTVNEAFSSWFGGTDAKTCKSYLLATTTDKARWVAAALNATSAAYPYSCDEVFAHYGSTKAAAALSFHKQFTL